MNFMKLDAVIEDLDLKIKLKDIFNKHGHITFLMDRTINESIFDNWLNGIKEDHIIYIPLAETNKKPNLFFLRLDDIDQFNQLLDEFEEYLLRSIKVENNEYYIYGFGLLNEDIKVATEKFKKRLKLSYEKNNFLFRWYDPRVKIYLEEIFDKEFLNYLYSIYSEWYFIHPSGLYGYNSNKYKKRRIKNITSVENINLDLIEIANLLYCDIAKKEDVDYLQIFFNLKVAVNKYGFEKYQDIVLFGHYSMLIGVNFLDHSIFKKLTENNIEFSELIDTIKEDEWLKIRSDLRRGTYE